MRAVIRAADAAPVGVGSTTSTRASTMASSAWRVAGSSMPSTITRCDRRWSSTSSSHTAHTGASGGGSPLQG